MGWLKPTYGLATEAPGVHLEDRRVMRGSIDGLERHEKKRDDRNMTFEHLSGLWHRSKRLPSEARL